MDLQLFLALNALTISAMAIASIVIYRPSGSGDWLSDNAAWLFVNAAVVVLGGAALWLIPEWTAWLVLGIFVPFVAAPVILFNLSQRRSQMGRVASAARYAYAAALLHPTTANWMNAHLTAALAQGERGDTQALEKLLTSAPPQYRAIVQAYLALARRDWSEILALAMPDGPADVLMKPLEIRALGETGRIDDMVRCYINAQPKFGSGAVMPKLVVLAFGGRPEAVKRLLDDKFSRMEKENRSYWTAVANFASATGSVTGESMLSQLASSAANPATRRASQRRLESAAAGSAAHAAPITMARLDQIADLALQSDPATRAAPQASYPVTLILITLNIAAFAAETFTGNSEDSDTLIRLGALWPPNVFEHGEWWRLLTAAFLHFGPIHIISNMFVLYVLGRLLEPMIGWVRFLAIYLIGALASSAFVLWLMWTGTTDYGLLVGASGAIFAIFGAEVAVVLQEWRSSRETFDTRRLTMLGVILLIQMSMDLSVPNISFSAHASGFLTGLFLQLVWPVRRRGRFRKTPSPPPNPISGSKPGPQT